MSLRKLIEGAGLAVNTCADVLGVDRDLFQRWSDFQQEIPAAYASVLAATLGVKLDAVLSRRHSADVSLSSAPAAIWFKFRGSRFTEADRESILLIRRLGHNANQLEQATAGQVNRTWDIQFDKVRLAVDLQSSPEEQGRAAARVFGEQNQLGHGGVSSAEILRSRLRSQGILLIESPVTDSQIEGCSFYVGDTQMQRPCIFINTYRTSWYRRNVIIMHELCHSIFDRASGGEVDTRDASDALLDTTSLEEVRATTFAYEALLPKRLLIATSKRTGLNCTELNNQGLALLVAETGVEKKTVVSLLRQYDLIDEALEKHYVTFDVSSELRGLSDHALSTKEYVSKIGQTAAKAWVNKRFTSSASSRRLLLPVPYVSAVIQAVEKFSISVSRACELLMIDRYTFDERFPELIAEVVE